MVSQENPFVYGEIIDNANLVNRTDELSQVVRDLADGQKSVLVVSETFRKEFASWSRPLQTEEGTLSNRQLDSEQLLRLRLIPGKVCRESVARCRSLGAGQRLGYTPSGCS